VKQMLPGFREDCPCVACSRERNWRDNPPAPWSKEEQASAALLMRMYREHRVFTRPDGSTYYSDEPGKP
jgi:hypothetical protein